MIEPLQFRMYLCTLNMKIYMIIYVWNMKMVWGYCFDKQLLKWYESVLAGFTLSCYALCLQVQKSVCVCVWLWFVCLFLSRSPAACPQTLTHSVFSSNAGRKWNWSQQVGNFIPSQHDGESRPLQRLVSSLSSAYTCDWRGLPLFPVASTLSTLYFCNTYSLTYFFF